MPNDIQKMKDQIRAIGETLDHKEHPIASMMIQFDWGDSELSIADDILEKYEKILEQSGKVSHTALEGDFTEKLNLGYQSVKSVMLGMFYADKWISVCIAYKKSMEPSPPIELRPIK